MAKKTTLGTKPKRVLTDFTEGNTVFWFDGVRDNKVPKLVQLTIFSASVDNSNGRLSLAATSAEKLDTTKPPSVPRLNVQPCHANWFHAETDGVRCFAFSNPFFLSMAEVAWLSKAGKTKDYRDHLMSFMSEVNIENPSGNNLKQYGIAMHNWISFWRSHKMSA
jgi:hypothetical protein